MNLRSRGAEDVRSEGTGQHPAPSQESAGISRRALLRASSGTAVIAGVGLAGWLEILQHREALAAGTVIVIGGITREPNEEDETPHRHTFSARFTVSSISPSAIIGDVAGRTAAVISTSSEKEDQHFHIIEGTDVSLEDLLLSGTEDNLPGEHAHLVSIE
jgi:hypothetical protein